MNAQEWNKLRKNWDKLCEQHPHHIIVQLYVNDVITDNDKKKIDKEGTTVEKMEKLLSILKSKPPEKKAFNALLKALEWDPVTSLLADEIRATETTSDVSLKSEVDLSFLNSEVRAVLHKHIQNTPGTSTKLHDIREILQKSGVFNGKNEWNNDLLADFVWKEFVGVEIKKVRKRNGKQMKKEICFTNIAIVDLKRTETAPAKEQESDAKLSLEKSDHKSKDAGNLKMKDMSPTQLKEYLHAKMMDEHLPTDILDDFVKEDVKGSIFLTMKENDFKEINPSATFGVRRFLSTQISENSFPPSAIPYREYLHKFDSEVKHTDKYIRGHCVNACINIGGKKTDPVRNFHLISGQNEEESLEYIGSEVVPFVSACLTDRRNGTIYFGISPSDSEQYKLGEIVGVNLSREQVQNEIRDFLKKSFSKSQHNLISCTVRDAKFVPVISEVSKDQESDLCVVEVDVVPSSEVMKGDTVRTKLTCLPIYAKKHRSKDAAVFRFSTEGVPEIISSDDLCNYEKDQERIVQQRQGEEAIQKHNQSSASSNLRTRLLNLLTGGTPTIQDTIFTFLMTSSIDTHMDEDYRSKNMTFIKWLNPEVVFDFDPTGSTNGMYKTLDSVQGEVMRVLTPDNFDKLQKSKEQYKHFTDGLANENRISWMFCNGYDVLSIDPLEPTEWNRKRRSAFQESLSFFKDAFGEDRIIVIICLFSKNYKVMIEACEEVLTKLPENWMLLAESEDIAKLWQDQILSRNKAERQDLVDRCVIGMPWEQVNLTIKHAVSDNELQDVCLLPTSTGAFVEIREKKLKDWCDIDVLSAGDFTVHENEREKKKREVEERFYRGEQASWLNFYFSDQVLKRDIHEELLQIVKDALEGTHKEEEDKVTSVPIFHQPGAGGTTSAKQVLWDLRKVYRCCVVNTITDQTCDQLDEIRAYHDSCPKPLLILIDNEDEDKGMQLRGNLEEKGRMNSRFADKSFSVYCAIILCIRRASLPRQIKHSQIALRQELTPKELEWFKVKNESLESRFNKDKERNVNPKFLISFNILRENFNKEYISKVVKEFSDDVKSATEVKLLEIISLLNTYDPEFKAIQVSCLDKMLENGQRITASRNHGTVKRNMKWEANLSQGVIVLLNLSSNKNHPGKARNSLRVFNKNIAQEILTRMKERTGKKESEMMMELLESGIFEQESSDSKKLQILINNVIKKREFGPDGIKRQKFSKFVIYVKTTEGAEVAVKILEQLFELNQDPFTAQLISRFYIDLKNWSSAEKFAKRATSRLPTNSFLWDTYGQVYKNQLFDRISPDGLKDEDIHGLIELSEKCIEVFRKEQTVSEHELTTNGDNNFAGYFGELRAIVLLLSALKMCPCFSSGDTLHKYLVDEHFKPGYLHFLNDREATYIKNLQPSSKEAMRRLDEEYLQMKGSVNLADMVNISSEYDRKSLLYLKVNLDEYFGEASDDVPRNLNESDTCEYTRRRVKKLGASSLSNLLTLRKHSQKEVIKNTYSLMLKNVHSRNSTFEDLKTLLDIVTVLLIDDAVPQGVQFEQILDWCKQLYTMNKPQGTDRFYLETFLYYVLYNFPTEERQKFNLCMISDLTCAIDRWHQAFSKNYPKFGREEIKLKRRETTLFFLGNGPPLQDIVHQDSLQEMERYSLAQKWDLPEVRQKLRMMSGSLNESGEKVILTITTTEGNKFRFSIQTSHRVNKKDMWQKKVFFYIGFSFSGPRAFGMSTEELGVTQALAPRIRGQTFRHSSRVKQENYPILPALYLEQKLMQAEIKKNPKKRMELEKKMQQINSNIRKVIGESLDD